MLLTKSASSNYSAVVGNSTPGCCRRGGCLAGVETRRNKDEQDVEAPGRDAVASCIMVPQSIPKVLG